MKKLMLLGIFASLFFAGCAQQAPTKNLDAFAQCLSDKGVIMYGSVTCGHCLKQKALFGESFKYINYVECTKEPQRCSNLEGVPTWEISSGVYLEGEQSLSILSEKTSCLLP